MASPSGYKFPILNSDGTYSSTIVDMADMFVHKELFLNANLFVCGYNGSGQLGNGTLVNYSSPIQVGSLTNWKQVSLGTKALSSIKTDGTLWACGYNVYGKLGNGTVNINYSSPIQVGTLTNWKQVFIGPTHTTSIKTDGTLWTWGQNNYGQLSNGTLVNYSSPIQVGSLTNWKQVSGALYYTTAIKTDGTLWSCGYGGRGAIGNGFSVTYSSPIQIGSLTNWKQVSGGQWQVAAIKTDGTLWAWGQDFNGSLGIGSLGSIYSSPIQVGALPNWKQVSCGYGPNTAAIKSDGTLWAWGSNVNGQLGNGTTVSYSSPIQVGSLTNWKQVSCGYNVISSIKTDGTLWAWGRNTFSQLGNGTSISYSSPIQIGSLTNWKQVASSFLDIAAISSPDLP